MLATPHLGASTAEAQLKVAKEVAQQFVAAVKGEGLMGVVCCLSYSLKLENDKNSASLVLKKY